MDQQCIWLGALSSEFDCDSICKVLRRQAWCNTNWWVSWLRRHKLFWRYQSSLYSSHLKRSMIDDSQLTRYCGNEFQSGTTRLLWVQVVEGSLSRRLLWPPVPIALCGLHANVRLLWAFTILKAWIRSPLSRLLSRFGVKVFEPCLVV